MEINVPPTNLGLPLDFLLLNVILRGKFLFLTDLYYDEIILVKWAGLEFTIAPKWLMIELLGMK